MSNIWFTSDLHLNHGNILKYSRRDVFLCDKDKQALQDFGGEWPDRHEGHYRISLESITNMNNGLIDSINNHVKSEDTLWHLGDFIFWKTSDTKVPSPRELRDRINCKNVKTIWGNHDRAKDLNGIFQEAHYYHELKIGDIHLILSHYSHAVWNKAHRGSIHLYGHSHGGAEKWLDKHLGFDRRSVDVGVDNIFNLLGAYRPISLDEIMEMMKDRTGSAIDHHIQS